MQAVENEDLKISRKRDIYPREGSEPNLFLAQCDFFTDATDLLPPIILFDRKGKYTAEAQEILSGRQHVTFA